MSNNKQNMKLYTESEVRKAIELARDTHQEGRAYMERDEYDYSIDEVVRNLTPIELPNDEEIDEESPYVPNDASIDFWSHKEGFVDGAKWMRDKIQGGNK
jgi:hypothetical protein